MGLASGIKGFPRLLLAGKPSRKDLCMLVGGIGFAIASGVPFPIIGIIFGQLLDDYNSVSCGEDDGTATSSSDAGEQSSIDGEILLIFYLAIAQFVLIYGHLTCWTLYGSRLAQRLRESYLQNLLRQEPSHFDELPPGEVASRLSSDIQTIRSGTAEKVGITLASLSFFVTAYIVAFVKDWELACILLSLIPAYFLMSFVGSYYIEKYSGLMSDHAASAASIASEALSNITIVQAFGATKKLEAKFAGALRSSEKEGLKKATAVGIQTGFLYFIAYSANGLAFWQGAHRVADAVRNGNGNATVGSTFTVIFILVEATLLLSQVAPFIHLFTAAVASYEKLREDLNREPLIDGTAEAGTRLQEAEGSFEIRDVSFRYPSRPEVTVLDHVSISIPAKKHTAIVGLSGSGKSTIASLAMRLYDPVGGQILFDGHDLHDLNTHDLRSFVSLVQQEPSLLDRTILENIAHGLVNSSSPKHAQLREVVRGSDLSELAAEVRKGQALLAAAEKRGPEVAEVIGMVQTAAQLADAADFISGLQHGYATQVGAMGRLVSGGQKQRVALARALVKDPRVLIMDEATAALDSRSERRITQAIGNIAGGRTVLTIAHRLSTITNADNIIVMHRGHVVEQGSHAELMARRGAYAELIGMQSLGAHAGETPRDAVSAAKPDHDSTTETIVERGESFSNDAQSTKREEQSPPVSEGSPSSEAGGRGDDDEAEPETPKKTLWQLARGYAPALRPHILVICAALLGSIIVGGAFSGEAVIFGNTVGALNTCKPASSIDSAGNFFGLMFFVLAVVEFFANVASWCGFGWVSEHMVYSVRVLSFRSLFEQDLEWHQSENRTPALLLSYITRDGNALAGLSGSVVGTIISISVNLVAAIVMTHIIAWKIALVCLAMIPLLLGAGVLELIILGRFEEKHETAYTRSVDIGTEAITHIKTVASLSLEDEVLGDYRRSLSGPRRETLKVTLQASLCQATTYFVGNCTNALAYWWGAKEIINGDYTTTEFLIVVFSLLVSALLFSQMFALAPELSSARAAAARILGLIEMGSQGMTGHVDELPPATRGADLEAATATTGEPKPQATTTMAAGGSAAASVQFRDVQFAYPARPDVKVLTGLTLDIKPGHFAALVGPSGAGKSTIISLVERLYTPQSGSILVGGLDVTRTSTSDVSFRDDIALVPQESVLFEGSIRFNLGLGSRAGHEATQAEIEEACRLANVHDVITALPDGYETLCGPGGSQFSGGQKQRLSIARALVRRPKLLILDEPTSALDAESERLLQDGLEKAARDMTVIAIAHRLHTIRKANRIFLIEAGTCVDAGTHEELLERSASYRSNVMHQTVAT